MLTNLYYFISLCSFRSKNNYSKFNVHFFSVVFSYNVDNNMFTDKQRNAFFDYVSNARCHSLAKM
eukprot:m.42492 g.42492  ORF g.42492 m.42492 type:complete len:65 (-) comp7061_c0_seq1:1278-1472(-)